MNNLSKIIFTCSVFMCASMFAMDNVNPAMDNANPTSQSVMSKVCNFLCHPIRYFRGRNITEQRLIESDTINMIKKYSVDELIQSSDEIVNRLDKIIYKANKRNQKNLNKLNYLMDENEKYIDNINSIIEKNVLY